MTSTPLNLSIDRLRSANAVLATRVLWEGPLVSFNWFTNLLFLHFSLRHFGSKGNYRARKNLLVYLKEKGPQHWGPFQFRECVISSTRG